MITRRDEAELPRLLRPEAPPSRLGPRRTHLKHDAEEASAAAGRLFPALPARPPPRPVAGFCAFGQSLQLPHLSVQEILDPHRATSTKPTTTLPGAKGL